MKTRLPDLFKELLHSFSNVCYLLIYFLLKNHKYLRTEYYDHVALKIVWLSEVGAHKVLSAAGRSQRKSAAGPR
jgi:hypothetical protein